MCTLMNIMLRSKEFINRCLYGDVYYIQTIAVLRNPQLSWTGTEYRQGGTANNSILKERKTEYDTRSHIVIQELNINSLSYIHKFVPRQNNILKMNIKI